MNLMSSVYPDVSEDMMISELGETVMIDVERYIDDKTVHYVTKDKFLSGDVLVKRDCINSLIEDGDTQADWERYLELILSVVPEPVVLSDIDFSIGSSWIPSNVVSQWVFNELLMKRLVSILKKQITISEIKNRPRFQRTLVKPLYESSI
ncbi:MAG: hypothetical protein ACLRX9_00655 [Streptococcus salivarius]